MKAKHITLPLAVILALAASSCTKGLSVTEGGSEVSLDVAIAPHGETKGIVNNANFPLYSTMGLFICKHDTAKVPKHFEAYIPKYNNIRAYQNSNDASNPVWSYTYNGTGTAFSTLYLLRPQTGEPAADFYAYAPFISNVTKPTSIPFNLQQRYDNLPDLMYAVENADSTSTNRNRTPDGKPIGISYHFVHKLAWIRCQFYLKNDDQSGTLGPGSSSNSQNASTVNSIKIRRKSGAATPLYVSGKFNGITGTFEDETGASTLVASDSLTVTYASANIYGSYWYPTFGTKGNTYGLLIYPVDYADGDYELVFKIDGKELETTYPIKRDDLKHPADTTYGFKEGYRYTFKFTYDNYQHISLSGTQIGTDANWDTKEEDFII